MKQTLSPQARTSIEGGVATISWREMDSLRQTRTSWSPYTEFGQAGRHKIQGGQDPVLQPPRWSAVWFKASSLSSPCLHVSFRPMEMGVAHGAIHRSNRVNSRDAHEYDSEGALD